jgi:hypothetical protein
MAMTNEMLGFRHVKCGKELEHKDSYMSYVDYCLQLSTANMITRIAEVRSGEFNLH